MVTCLQYGACMTTKIAAVLIFISACATGGAARTDKAATPNAALRDSPNPRHGLPPATPMTDPETVERRFGFGEARARREEGQRRAHDHDHDHLGVVGDGPTGKTKVAPPPPAAPRDENQGDAKATCPCKQEPAAGH